MQVPLLKSLIHLVVMANPPPVPPAGPVRSLEFYYNDGNVVFEVRTSSLSFYRNALISHLLTGFKCSLSTPPVNPYFTS